MFLVSGDTEFGKQKMDDNFFGTWSVSVLRRYDGDIILL